MRPVLHLTLIRQFVGPVLSYLTQLRKRGEWFIISSFYLKILYEKHDYRGVKSKGSPPIPASMLVGREKHHLGKN